MSANVFNSLVNTSFVDVFILYVNNISVFLTDCVEHRTTSIYNLFENLPNYLQFDEFQLTLLKGFSVTLLITLFLIYASWRVFGKNICERFMKPATSKTIEELKASVSRLKLPKEHSPRI